MESSPYDEAYQGPGHEFSFWTRYHKAGFNEQILFFCQGAKTSNLSSINGESRCSPKHRRRINSSFRLIVGLLSRNRTIFEIYYLTREKKRLYFVKLHTFEAIQ